MEHRVIDQAARDEFAADPAPEGLAAARLAVEHLSHHDAPLRFLGSRYAEDTVHRFGCAAPACQFRLTITVHAP